MKKVLVGLLMAVSFSVSAVDCDEKTEQRYKYDRPVTIEGFLVTSTANSDITYDEKAHKFPALVLVDLISTVCEKSEANCQSEKHLNLFQLVLNEKLMSKFSNLKGNYVKINGALFHSDNGHQFTPVLVDVSAISN